MTVITLEYGLILKAPDLASELAYLFEEWQNHSSDSFSETSVQLNPSVWDTLEDEYE